MMRLENILLRHDGFSLSADCGVDTGAFVAVIGPSGAGKSTLLSGIAGFAPLASGRITWNGTPIDTLAPGDRPVAMLFQDQNLFPHMSVVRNVGLGLRPGRLRPTEAEQVSAALDRVGLNGLADRRPAALSGGQQSRAALARLLVQKRPLWLLDEPFAALGPAMKQDMLTLVRDSARDQGATVLMVTHDPKDAMDVADETMLVSDGSVFAPRETHSLFADPPPELRAYLGR